MPNKGSVLLVEDNEGDVELTSNVFSTHLPAHRLLVANDGAAALEVLAGKGAYANEPRPRLILLDLNMPRMDGKRFLEVVKADPELRSIPVVMFTSSDSPRDVRDCYERHANCYVVKPFAGVGFSETVTQIVTFWFSRAVFA